MAGLLTDTNIKPEKLAYTYDEAADMAGVSIALVRKLVRNGNLERIKIGRCTRVPRHALLALCGVPGKKASGE